MANMHRHQAAGWQIAAGSAECDSTMPERGYLAMHNPTEQGDDFKYSIRANPAVLSDTRSTERYTLGTIVRPSRRDRLHRRPVKVTPSGAARIRARNRGACLESLCFSSISFGTPVAHPATVQRKATRPACEQDIGKPRCHKESKICVETRFEPQ
jgi:hypothetical protein